MKIHPRKLAAAWLIWSLVVIMLTAMVVQAGQEEIIKVEYIVIPAEEVEEVPEVIDEPEEVEESEVVMTSLGTYKITAYCPCEICCGEYADGYTWTGEVATEGLTIATYPDDIPLDTNVYIDGVGERTAQDIGGSIYENNIDLFFATHQQAKEWGVQYLEVWEVK